MQPIANGAFLYTGPGCYTVGSDFFITNWGQLSLLNGAVPGSVSCSGPNNCEIFASAGCSNTNGVTISTMGPAGVVTDSAGDVSSYQLVYSMFAGPLALIQPSPLYLASYSSGADCAAWVRAPNPDIVCVDVHVWMYVCACALLCHSAPACSLRCM